MEELIADLIDTMRKNLVGRATNCGGELDSSICKVSCEHHPICQQNYDTADAFDRLYDRAEQLKSLKQQGFKN